MAGTDKYGDLRHSKGRHLSPYKDLSDREKEYLEALGYDNSQETCESLEAFNATFMPGTTKEISKRVASGRMDLLLEAVEEIPQVLLNTFIRYLVDNGLLYVPCMNALVNCSKECSQEAFVKRPDLCPRCQDQFTVVEYSQEVTGPWLFRNMRCGNCKLEWEAKFLPDTYTVSSSGE